MNEYFLTKTGHNFFAPQIQVALPAKRLYLNQCWIIIVIIFIIIIIIIIIIMIMIMIIIIIIINHHYYYNQFLRNKFHWNFNQKIEKNHSWKCTRKCKIVNFHSGLNFQQHHFNWLNISNFKSVQRAYSLCPWCHKADSRLVPSQWEMSLQSNAVSHWLGANLESDHNARIIFILALPGSLWWPGGSQAGTGTSFTVRFWAMGQIHAN